MLQSSIADPRLLDLATTTVPRYTSYPTAPQFTADVGPETYSRWLELEAVRGGPPREFGDVVRHRRVVEHEDGRGQLGQAR